MGDNHMTAREFVGREIRSAREKRGLSRAALAKMFPVSESLVAWWEAGRTLPSEKDLARLIKILELPEMIIRIIDDLVSKEVAPEWVGKWFTLEARSSSLLTFQPSNLPGLLQTEDYSRAVLRLGKQSPLSIDDQVLSRQTRQKKVLGRDNPALYHAILDEAVIRRPVGGRKTMCDQLMHVVEMAQRTDTIIVQVIPFDKGEHAGFVGPFVLASFDGKEVAYVDNALRADVVEKPEDVAAIRRVWQMLSAKALPEEESLQLIKEVVNSWIT